MKREDVNKIMDGGATPSFIVCKRGLAVVGVQAVGAGCPSLTSLILVNRRQVSDFGVQAIGIGCSSLTK